MSLLTCIAELLLGVYADCADVSVSDDELRFACHFTPDAELHLVIARRGHADFYISTSVFGVPDYTASPICEELRQTVTYAFADRTMTGDDAVAAVVLEACMHAVTSLRSAAEAAATCRRHATCNEAAAPATEESGVVCVCRIDHMRSAQRYTKRVQQLAMSEGVHALLVVAPAGASPHVCMFVHGAASCVKAFLVAMRTTDVDVDSSGRPCKERMLRVLHTLHHSVLRDGVWPSSPGLSVVALPALCPGALAPWLDTDMSSDVEAAVWGLKSR